MTNMQPEYNILLKVYFLCSHGFFFKTIANPMARPKGGSIILLNNK